MLVSTSPLFLAESLAQLCHVGFALHVNERHAGVVCFAEGIVAVEEIPVDALLHWAEGIEAVIQPSFLKGYLFAQSLRGILLTTSSTTLTSEELPGSVMLLNSVSPYSRIARPFI